MVSCDMIRTILKMRPKMALIDPSPLAFLSSVKLRMLFFPLIHVKMPTIVGILTFMSGKNFILKVTQMQQQNVHEMQRLQLPTLNLNLLSNQIFKM